MAERWYYKHGGAVLGPVSDEQLKQLAASGALLPADVIWAEGKNEGTGVEAELLMDFTALRQAKPAAGNWLGKVAQTLATPKAVAPSTTPDWLADLQQAVGSQPTLAPNQSLPHPVRRRKPQPNPRPRRPCRKRLPSRPARSPCPSGRRLIGHRKKRRGLPPRPPAPPRRRRSRLYPAGHASP